jgi:hypothetical protein
MFVQELDFDVVLVLFGKFLDKDKDILRQCTVQYYGSWEE